jgi:hypothetical protein
MPLNRKNFKKLFFRKLFAKELKSLKLYSTESDCKSKIVKIKQKEDIRKLRLIILFI